MIQTQRCIRCGDLASEQVGDDYLCDRHAPQKRHVTIGERILPIVDRPQQIPRVHGLRYGDPHRAPGSCPCPCVHCSTGNCWMCHNDEGFT